MENKKPLWLFLLAVGIAVAIWRVSLFLSKENSKGLVLSFPLHCGEEHLEVKINRISLDKLTLQFSGIGVQGLVGEFSEENEFDDEVEVETKLLSNLSLSPPISLKPLGARFIKSGKTAQIDLDTQWSITAQRCEADVADGFHKSVLNYGGKICCGELIWYSTACANGDKESCKYVEGF
ncbi:MAG: hypothetical protein FJZ63_07355 [Chlamydiae bacterium]|nr:hypothetical protein [Chlamydiota bacterium]